MECEFDIVYERRNTCCLKWDCTCEVFHEKDVLPMWIADMDFKACDEIIAAIGKRNEHGIYGYMESMPESYRDAIVNWMEKRHHWEVSREWLCCTPGVVPALAFSILAFTEPEDRVIIQSPVYPPFYKIINDNNRRIVENPLKFNGIKYFIDFEDLEQKMIAGAKMLILCSPHNPAGRVWKQEELDKISELCLKYKVLVVADEIHADIVYEKSTHIPIASLSDEVGGNSITCIAASKTFNIAGLSTSVVIIPNKKLREAFCKKVRSVGFDGCNIFGVIATEAAYRYGGEWLDRLLVYLHENLEFMVSYFENNIPDIRVIKPEGTFLAWLDCRSLMMNSTQLSDFMVQKAKVGLNDGIAFGKAGEGFLRINFACPRSTLKEGLQRIEKAVKLFRRSNKCSFLSRKEK